MPLFSRTKTTNQRNQRLELQKSTRQTQSSGRGRGESNGNHGVGSNEFGAVKAISRWIILQSCMRWPSADSRRSNPPQSSDALVESTIHPPHSRFASTHLPNTNSNGTYLSTTSDGELRQYGVLGGIGKDVVLGIEDVANMLRDVGNELQRRGKSSLTDLLD